MAFKEIIEIVNKEYEFELDIPEDADVITIKYCKGQNFLVKYFEANDYRVLPTSALNVMAGTITMIKYCDFLESVKPLEIGYIEETKEERIEREIEETKKLIERLKSHKPKSKWKFWR